ncbi:hypothetical protein SAMN05443529_10571 [Desulfosporosinus hippei DSM 8344]|uniref:Uncharacterized protein n=1 Tax=Desulfosporosinus hippei DSM 8344 TaxID=1121419 RepID=A0A1G7W9K0_9FIRM|nr:hypothetical protein SAMN05443529_10571 [Desulfosporosinus hippei DSM 8344]
MEKNSLINIPHFTIASDEVLEKSRHMDHAVN